MFEHLTIKWIVSILAIGLTIYMITLFFNEDGRSIFEKEPHQEYVTAQVDSTIAVRQLNPKSPNVVVDSVYIPDFTALKTKADSDSLVRYDLYRRQQAVVTIDLEKHEEHTFFTWEDVRAYFHGVRISVENIKKKYNDHH